MAYQASSINRQNYNSRRYVRAHKTLRQLIVLAVNSSKGEGLAFGQIRAALKKSLKLAVSNFILKRTLHQLVSSGHLKRGNYTYKSTGKRVQPPKLKKNTSRKRRNVEKRARRRRFMNQSNRARRALSKNVKPMIAKRYAVLKRVIMKAMRALRRAENRKHSKGFLFNSIKARVKIISKKKNNSLKNITIIRALQDLRASGSITLRNGRNFIGKAKRNNPKKSHTKAKRKSVKKSSKKMTRKSRKVNKRSKKVVKKSEKKVESWLEKKSNLSIASTRFTEELIKKSLMEAKKELKN